MRNSADEIGLKAIDQAGLVQIAREQGLCQIIEQRQELGRLDLAYPEPVRRMAEPGGSQAFLKRQQHLELAGAAPIVTRPLAGGKAMDNGLKELATVGAD